MSPNVKKALHNEDKNPCMARFSDMGKDVLAGDVRLALCSCWMILQQLLVLVLEVVHLLNCYKV